MRSDADGDDADGADGHAANRHDEAAAAVLPPAREQPFDPDEQLWHTASFAAITDEPSRRRKLATGLSILGVATLGLCGFAGVKLAALAGVTAPSPPRYVITEQAHAQEGGLQEPEAPPASPVEPEAPPASLAVGPQPPPPAGGATPTSQPRPAAKARARDGNNDDHKPSKAKHRRKKSDDG